MRTPPIEKKLRCRKCGELFVFRTNSPMLKIMYELHDWKKNEIFTHKCEDSFAITNKGA